MDGQDHESELEGDGPVAAEAGMMVDRRELALVAVERTRMPMVMVDPRQPDAPIVLANQAFLDLTGYSAAEVIGRNCRFLQGPGTDPADIETIRRGLREGHDIDIELVNYRKDGSSFVNQLAISPILGKNGRLLYYFASQKDVTERRRLQTLEETERRLLKEVDHRAMNAMAIVQSIVRMSRGDSVEAYSAAIQGRVDTLARAHRLLANRGWSGAGLEELVAAETNARGRSITVQGPPVPLAARLVQPVSLVLHELMSNALAHGALAAPGGTVAVTWGCDGERATLDWRESGSRPVQPPARRGFGLGTIEAVVGRQLGGSVALEWTPQGLHATLAFPTGTAEACG